MVSRKTTGWIYIDYDWYESYMTCKSRANFLGSWTVHVEISAQLNWLCVHAYFRRDLAAQCSFARASVPRALALDRKFSSAC
jgi:hypothetical protein